MSSIATHTGTVVGIAPHSVNVKIETLSACAQCAAHGRCGFAESKEQTLQIDTTEWNHYAMGDHVEVQVSQRLGMQAVLLAYFLPALLLVAGVVLFLRWFSEPLTVLLTLVLLTAYFLLLYRFRQRLQKRFTFAIRKLE